MIPPMFWDKGGNTHNLRIGDAIKKLVFDSNHSTSVSSSWVHLFRSGNIYRIPSVPRNLKELKVLVVLNQVGTVLQTRVVMLEVAAHAMESSLGIDKPHASKL